MMTIGPHNWIYTQRNYTESEVDQALVAARANVTARELNLPHLTVTPAYVRGVDVDAALRTRGMHETANEIMRYTSCECA
jgi:hypothetical protein